MFIILNSDNLVIGETKSEAIKNISKDTVIEIDVEVVPSNVVGNYKHIDGEFIEEIAE